MGMRLFYAKNGLWVVDCLLNYYEQGNQVAKDKKY